MALLVLGRRGVRHWAAASLEASIPRALGLSARALSSVWDQQGSRSTDTPQTPPPLRIPSQARAFCDTSAGGAGGGVERVDTSGGAGGGVERVECVVVGAGVVGLAIARELAMAGREVVVLESEGSFGTGTSSRNSEVIHAGFYYPPGSLKAQLCLEGKKALYQYCAERDIGHKRVGKLVVATSAEQVPQLLSLEARGRENGVEGLRVISAEEVRDMEPQVSCVRALHSASTGIVDSHSLMAALQAEAEDSGAAFAYNAPVLGVRRTPAGLFHLAAGEWPDPDSRQVSATSSRGGETSQAGAAASESASDDAASRPAPAPSLVLEARVVVNAAGLSGVPLGHRIEGFPKAAVPRRHLARGHYFGLAGWKPPPPFSRLIYPMPEEGGIGIHVTLDLSGGIKFGPDVQWLPPVPDDDLFCTFDYRVDERRAERFYGEIRKYFPALPDNALQADYSGIRPKIYGQGEPAADFMIQDGAAYGFPGLVNLFGIESPGLTCALAIGPLVKSLLDKQ